MQNAFMGMVKGNGLSSQRTTKPSAWNEERIETKALTATSTPYNIIEMAKNNSQTAQAKKLPR